MKPLILTYLCLLVLQPARAVDPPDFSKPVDSVFRKGQFIDIDPKAAKRLWVRYSPIADTGVELELTQGNKLLWRAYVEPLGVAHSAYQQNVDVEVDDFSPGEVPSKIDVTSVASGGNIFEMRSLKNGKRLSRKVTDKHSPIRIPAGS